MFNVALFAEAEREGKTVKDHFGEMVKLMNELGNLFCHWKEWIKKMPVVSMGYFWNTVEWVKNAERCRNVITWSSDTHDHKGMSHPADVCVLSPIWLFVTPWTVARQAPLSVEFSRQEYWSGLPFLSPGDLLDPGIKLASPVLAGRFFTSELDHVGTRKLPCSTWRRSWWWKHDFTQERQRSSPPPHSSFDSPLSSQGMTPLHCPPTPQPCS